jgi:hypothetical protein
MRKQDCVVNEYRLSEYYRHKSRIIINRTQQTVLNIFFRSSPLALDVHESFLDRLILWCRTIQRIFRAPSTAGGGLWNLLYTSYLSSRGGLTKVAISIAITRFNWIIFVIEMNMIFQLV